MFNLLSVNIILTLYCKIIRCTNNNLTNNNLTNNNLINKTISSSPTKTNKAINLRFNLQILISNNH